MDRILETAEQEKQFWLYEAASTAFFPVNGKLKQYFQGLLKYQFARF
jgi:homoserine dehydrogenase